jgi:hypothetical protein
MNKGGTFVTATKQKFIFKYKQIKKSNKRKKDLQSGK